MKKEELEHIMEEILENAKSLLSKDGYLAPVAFLCIGNEIRVIPLSFKNREEKERQVVLLTNVARMENADALIMVAESWYVTSDKPSLEIEPSRHPMRKECVFVIGEYEEGNITISQKFEREEDKEGDRIIFGDIDNMNTFGISKFNFGIKNRKKYDNSILKPNINYSKSNLN